MSKAKQPLDVVVESDGPDRGPMARGVLAKLESSPLVVNGTWDSARRWRDLAVKAEEAKLFCQVMLGFELLAMRETHGETRGGPAVRTSDKETFADVAMRETGLGRDSVFKIIRMAEESVPRLKKLPQLRGFDPFAQPIGQLPEPQQSALSAAVRKLTDGLTQADFMAELGLGKAAQGSGARGGYRPRVNDSPSVTELAEMEAKAARQNFRMLTQIIGTKPERFTLLEDAEVHSEIAVLELAARARRQWLAQPKGHRDPSVVTQLFADF